MYSDEMAAMRVRGLLQSGRLAEASKALEVTYEGKEQLTVAPWRLWVDVQVGGGSWCHALYFAGQLWLGVG